MSDARLRYGHFWLLWCSQCITIAGLTVIVPHLLLYLQELGGVDATALQWWSGLCLLAPFCTQFLSAPLWGRLGDRWSRKWMVVRALFGLSLTFGCMALVQAPWQFFLCRLLQGICGGITEANIAFAITQTDPKKSGRILGRLNGATAAGSLIGPVAGSLLATFLGYKALFTMMAGLLILCTIWAALVLQEGAQVHGSETISSPSISLRETLLRLVRHRMLRGALLLGCCAQMGIYGVVGIMPLYIGGLLNNTEQVKLWIGGLQAVTWGVAMLSSPWWGRRNDKRSVVSSLLLATICCGISIILQGFVHSMEGLLFLRLLQGFFLSAIVPSIYLCVRQEVPEKLYSSYTGMVSSILLCGQILGPLLATLLLLRFSPAWVIGWMGLLYLIGAVCLFLPSLQMRNTVSTPDSRTALHPTARYD
jgi:MFS family permease